MKNFINLELCNYHSEDIDIHVRASLTDCSLSIFGHDLGPTVEKYWGDDDYEYWYTFDRENTAKLFAVIHGENDPEEALLREFSGEYGCKKLRLVCQKNKIHYDFFSYV